MDRRKFLGTTATAGTFLIAGCKTNVEASKGEVANKDVSAPSVEIPDSWESTTPDSRPKVFKSGEVLGKEWDAIGHTKIYENKALRERIHKETFEKVDKALMVAFASRIQFFPSYAHLGSLAYQEEIDSAIRSRMRGRMKSFDLKNITYKGEEQMVSGSKPHSYHKWTADYHIDEIPVKDVNIPNSDVTSFTIGGEDIKIEALAGVWKEGKHMLAAGGVYPAELFTEEKEWDISGAVHLNLSVEMGFKPEQYNRQVKSFMDSVSS